MGGREEDAMYALLMSVLTVLELGEVLGRGNF